MRAVEVEPLQPMEQARMVAAEPLQPMEQARMVAAEPVQRMEAVQAEPLQRVEQLQPFQRAEPVQRVEQLQPFERAEPLQRMEAVQAEPFQHAEQLQPLQRAEPLQRMQAVQAEPAHLATHDALRATEATPTTTHDALRATEASPRLAAQDMLSPTEPAHLAARDALRPTEATRRTDLAPGTAATRGAAATDPDGAEAAKRRAPAGEQGAPSGSGGSAGTGFKVDPAQYMAAVSPLLAAADQLSQLVTGLTSFLDHTQSTAPWGNDESGKKFAEGEKGYLKYSTETQKGLKGMPDAVRYIADGLKAMAENYQNAEDATTAVFQSDGGGGEPSAAPQVGTYSAPVHPTIPTGALGSIAQGRPSTHTTGRA
ncbi:hypothetical protein [Kitasatospora sp. NPDC094015]|uniref:hypothetical protein n=1 Tax=Kitasatospora sp. NPDC094015 TaxID=3155205 RepID=UPI00332692FB